MKMKSNWHYLQITLQLYGISHFFKIFNYNMYSQIFKKKIPFGLLKDFIVHNCIKSNNNFIINNNVFKKLVFNNSLITFIESCKEYYHISKLHYLEKKLTYNSFLTIVRQICNYHTVKYTSKIKYNKSKYEIEYYLFFDDHETDQNV